MSAASGADSWERGKILSRHAGFPFALSRFSLPFFLFLRESAKSQFAFAAAHVGRAARRIGRSQPAVSHALMRLRELLGDPLLVRTGSRMELTPRALALKESLPETLERVRGLLATESFQAATSARHFKIVMHDHLADLFVADLVTRMQSLAVNSAGRTAPSPTARPRLVRAVAVVRDARGNRSCRADDARRDG